MKQTLIILALCFFITPTYAQKKATTEDGQIVILLDDGTWQLSREVKPIASLEKKGDCDFKTNQKDEFTGAQEVMLASKEIAKDLYCTLLSVNKVKAFFLNYVEDLGCLSSDSYIIFKFTDGSTLKMLNTNRDIDCGEGISFQGIIKKDEMDQLSKKEIEKIRLSYTDAVRDLDVTDKTHFIFGLACLLL